MLMRLSRALFWLAALGAAMALMWTGRVQMFCSAAAIVLAFTAYATWRADLARGLGERADPDSFFAPAAFDAQAVAEAESIIVRSVSGAVDFEAALHALARVMKGEIGAAESRVFAVSRGGSGEALLAEMFVRRPGFKALSRKVSASEHAIAQALLGQREIALAPGAVAIPDAIPDEIPDAMSVAIPVAIPVAIGGSVVALIEWRGIGIAIEPRLLEGLLAIARGALEASAAVERAPAARLSARTNQQVFA